MVHKNLHRTYHRNGICGSGFFVEIASDTGLINQKIRVGFSTNEGYPFQKWINLEEFNENKFTNLAVGVTKFQSCYQVCDVRWRDISPTIRIFRFTAIEDGNAKDMIAIEKRNGDCCFAAFEFHEVVYRGTASNAKRGDEFKSRCYWLIDKFEDETASRFASESVHLPEKPLLDGSIAI